MLKNSRSEYFFVLKILKITDFTPPEKGKLRGKSVRKIEENGEKLCRNSHGNSQIEHLLDRFLQKRNPVCSAVSVFTAQMCISFLHFCACVPQHLLDHSRMQA
jgi:hypothetical protein